MRKEWKYLGMAYVNSCLVFGGGLFAGLLLVSMDKRVFFFTDLIGQFAGLCLGSYGGWETWR